MDFVQDFLVQAQYWHDPLHFDTYVEKSQFIAEVNNEKAEKNASYAINLANLENFVLVKNNQVGCLFIETFDRGSFARTAWWSPASPPTSSSTPLARLT